MITAARRKEAEGFVAEVVRVLSERGHTASLKDPDRYVRSGEHVVLVGEETVSLYVNPPSGERGRWVVSVGSSYGAGIKRWMRVAIGGIPVVEIANEVLAYLARLREVAREDAADEAASARADALNQMHGATHRLGLRTDGRGGLVLHAEIPVTET